MAEIIRPNIFLECANCPFANSMQRQAEALLDEYIKAGLQREGTTISQHIIACNKLACEGMQMSDSFIPLHEDQGDQDSMIVFRAIKCPGLQTR